LNNKQAAWRNNETLDVMVSMGVISGGNYQNNSTNVNNLVQNVQLQWTILMVVVGGRMGNERYHGV